MALETRGLVFVCLCICLFVLYNRWYRKKDVLTTHKKNIQGGGRIARLIYDPMAAL